MSAPAPSIRHIVVCPSCGTAMLDAALYCPKCGEARTAERERIAAAAAGDGVPYGEMLERMRGPYPELLSTERRRAILHAHIAYWMERDYRVVSQTDTAAQMLKPKQFSTVIAILTLLLLVVGLVLYVISYLGEPTVAVFLSVDDRGALTTIHTGQPF